ncbi:uncharacterized protein LOC131860375 [Cryptomeria japonica]|uniref:uncharacterized protein LOC131860375 n=1 Tax=Cryptomeria japonica TaxID=3369 RepID=UPI0027DAA907|nr:uncharacterized protein LOC131860375 [Cryptomeria japonica]
MDSNTLQPLSDLVATHSIGAPIPQILSSSTATHPSDFLQPRSTVLAQSGTQYEQPCNQCLPIHQQTNTTCIGTATPISDHFRSLEFTHALASFRTRIDNLSHLHVCIICKEKYIGMHVKLTQREVICSRCYNEKGVLQFSIANNMDPGEQPIILKRLSQVEEMLIARIALVLQVSHARGGQYKYIGHTINFPQDISKIATTLPRKFQHLEIVIIRRTNLEGKKYDCYVNRFNVMDTLSYKIQHDHYYNDVIIGVATAELLPLTTIDISDFLHTLPNCIDPQPPLPTQDPLYNVDEVELQPTSSFIPKLPCSTAELDAIKKMLHLDNDDQNVATWPEISFSPINEYNTEGLFTMAFPTLFPNESALPLQPRTKHIHLHEYALHMIRYHNQRFGQHVRFRYYLYNLIMRHCSQQSASVFLRTNLEDSFPTMLQDLCEQLQSTPSDQLPNQLMHFAASLRGTRAYWNRSRRDLTTMVHQLGAPTLFFTLSVADTKWPELHKLFPATPSSGHQTTKKTFIENIV